MWSKGHNHAFARGPPESATPAFPIHKKALEDGKTCFVKVLLLMMMGMLGGGEEGKREGKGEGGRKEGVGHGGGGRGDGAEDDIAFAAENPCICCDKA